MLFNVKKSDLKYSYNGYQYDDKTKITIDKSFFSKTEWYEVAYMIEEVINDLQLICSRQTINSIEDYIKSTDFGTRDREKIKSAIMYKFTTF